MSVVPWEREIQQILTTQTLKIQRASEQKQKGKCIALYGRTGVGKTELINRLAKTEYGRPMLYFNIDGGSWVLDNNDAYIIDVVDYTDFSTPMMKLSTSRKLPFKCIVVDNVSSLQVSNITDIQGATGKSIQGSGMATQQQWGMSTAQLLNVYHMLWVIAQNQGIHVITTAWEDDRTNKVTNQTVRSGIGVTPSLARSLPGMMNMVGHITVKQGGVRVINFDTSPHSDAKMQRRQTKAELSVPLTIAYRDQNILEDLLNSLVGGIEWPTDKYKGLAAQAKVDYATVTQDQPTGVETAVAQRLSDEQTAKEDTT
jgi:phage nucleotide-binding protein